MLLNFVSNKAKLNINFEKLNYLCGEQVNGTISQKVNEATPAGCIVLKLKGKEKVAIKDWETEHYETAGIDGESYSSSRQVPVEYKEKKIIYNYAFNVYEFPGGMMTPGQFKLPFSFVLPTELPSTFDHQWKTWGQCEATVKHTAKLKVVGATDNQSFKFEKEFFVISPPPPVVDGNLRKEVSKSIRAACCIPRGDYKITCYTERNSYFCGEYVWMLAELKNDTSKPISNVYGLFQRKLIVNAEKKSRTVEDNEKGVDGGSVEPNEEKRGTNAMKIGCSSIMTTRNDKSGPKYNTSCKGSLIQCSYSVKATFVPTICCNCSGDPTIHFDVNMLIPQIPNKIIELDGWGKDVQEMPAYVANFSPEHAVQVSQLK